MNDCNESLGGTLWRQGGLRCVVRPASPQDDSDSDYPDAGLTGPCLPQALLASRLLLSRVLPAGASRPPTASTA